MTRSLTFAAWPQGPASFWSQTTGALYVWELERGRKTWRVPVRGGVVTNDGPLAVSMADGLAYAFEPMVRGCSSRRPGSSRSGR